MKTYSYQEVIDWAKSSCERRKLEVPNDYWNRFNYLSDRRFEYEFAEDTLNLLIACAFNFVVYGKEYTLNEAEAKRLKAPTPRFDASFEKNYCGSLI